MSAKEFMKRQGWKSITMVYRMFRQGRIIGAELKDGHLIISENATIKPLEVETRGRKIEYKNPLKKEGRKQI